MKISLVALGFSTIAVSLMSLPSCGDPDPCVSAFHRGDRLQITLARARNVIVPPDCGAVGVDVGKGVVITLDDPVIAGEGQGCTGYRVGLSLNDFDLRRLEDSSSKLGFGATFNATYKGTCRGSVSFSLYVFSQNAVLPIRSDPNEEAFVEFNIQLHDGCSPIYCATQFVVNVEKI